MKILLLLLAVLFSTATVSAQSLGKETLRGIAAVEVLVEKLRPEIESLGLTTQALKTDAELRLRRAGVRIAVQKSYGDEIGTLYIQIKPSPVSGNPGLYVYSNSVVLMQNVNLARPPKLLALATTYDVGSSFGTLGENRLRNLRDIVADKVDVFINDYLEMNAR